MQHTSEPDSEPMRVTEADSMRLISVNNATAADMFKTHAQLEQRKGHQPGAALFFNWAATRLRMGRAFSFELASVRPAPGDVSSTDCNTDGQIARSEGQFSGFHNCTAVVAIFPK